MRRELQNAFKGKLGLENVQIERAHQIRNKGNKDKKDQINNKKKKVLKNATKLQGRKIFINEDFAMKPLDREPNSVSR